MKVLQIFQYVYLFFAVIFIYDAISNIGVDTNRMIISFVFAGLGIFMFFFRKRFRKKFEDRNK
ncbi:hypothetical protein [Psychroserpens sp.]|uniref:hypothetical protein n=1 Tax=Psychroserpens sp. TaxID=2020870 RepID=UPI001B1614FF|nr:hypothetical protein [Psychroserpens sp.]MBO6605833.1 hypothetical protein [Psychroserpens sp.]MBO6630470.1 hypothetical protein [Psychroserpens sp.]MBO6652796.1 hypothetical protein [Psychroserpens sp.]MBO6681432.1 hypothetical protein [Psychroserpens sp.]MBO6749207.1 hypothetical protein [Psychroserpens sp.]